MMKKSIFAFALVAVFVASAAFAAPQEAHSWEDLQRLCRTGLVAADPQGRPTTDGGRLGYLRWDVEWRITDDWRVFSESATESRTGDVIPAGRQFYAWFLGDNANQKPTTPTTPVSSDQKAEAVMVETYEELAAISSTPLQDNGDGGKGATLTRPLRVGKGQKVLCDSEEPLPEGTVVPAGKFVYMWLADEEDVSALPVVTFSQLSQYGKTEMKEDGIWNTYVPFEDCVMDTANMTVFSTSDFNNEVENGKMESGKTYIFFVNSQYSRFVPENDAEFAILSHPKLKPTKNVLWTPESGSIQNWDVTLAGDWIVPDEVEAFLNSSVAKATGETLPKGSKPMLNLRGKSSGGAGSSNGEGGGGGCDSGAGSFALLAVVTFLLRKGR